MKLFIDTANIAEIREINDWGIICGVTTNPSVIAKEGRVFEEVIKEITSIVDGPISAEVISLKADGMVAEARELAKRLETLVVKIPATSGADGRLYGSITAKDIAERLEADHKIVIDKRRLVLNENIKAYGKYEVEAKLYTEITGRVNVLVCEK